MRQQPQDDGRGQPGRELRRTDLVDDDQGQHQGQRQRREQAGRFGARTHPAPGVQQQHRHADGEQRRQRRDGDGRAGADDLEGEDLPVIVEVAARHTQRGLPHPDSGDRGLDLDAAVRLLADEAEHFRPAAEAEGHKHDGQARPSRGDRHPPAVLRHREKRDDEGNRPDLHPGGQGQQHRGPERPAADEQHGGDRQRHGDRIDPGEGDRPEQQQEAQPPGRRDEGSPAATTPEQQGEGPRIQQRHQCEPAGGVEARAERQRRQNGQQSQHRVDETGGDTRDVDTGCRVGRPAEIDDLHVAQRPAG